MQPVPSQEEQTLYRQRLRRSGMMRDSLISAAVHQSLKDMVEGMIAWRQARQAAKDAAQRPRSSAG